MPRVRCGVCNAGQARVSRICPHDPNDYIDQRGSSRTSDQRGSERCAGSGSISHCGISCNSTGPTDPRCAERTGLSISCAPVGGALQCGATALYYCPLVQTDVTAQARWQSSDPGIVAVFPGGLAQSVSPGDAQISATDGFSSFVRVRVLPGEPPLPLYELLSFVAVMPCGPNDRISGALVTVTSGLNVGRSATSGNVGSYSIPDVVYGPITLRAGKAGYNDAVLNGAVGYSPGISTICLTPAQS
jgi:hypothetical protein